RLEENETESLVIARRDVEVRDREQLVLRHVVHGSAKPYTVRDAHACRLVPQLRLLGALADDEELHARIEHRDGGDQPIESLAGDAPADAGQPGRALL